MCTEMKSLNHLPNSNNSHHMPLARAPLSLVTYLVLCFDHGPSLVTVSYLRTDFKAILQNTEPLHPQKTFPQQPPLPKVAEFWLPQSCAGNGSNYEFTIVAISWPEDCRLQPTARSPQPAAHSPPPQRLALAFLPLSLL